MLLVIDVGNTNIVLGIYDGQRLEREWRIATDRGKTPDEYGILINALFGLSGRRIADITALIIASVVPPVTGIMERLARQFFGLKPCVVGAGIRTGMVILADNPREVGADRIVNAVAGYEKYRCALVIVDFGTATTFDYVNREGEFCGGAIAPGLSISLEALFQKASRLPRVEAVKPPQAIARNTVDALQAGIVFGYAGLVDGIVTRMKEEGQEQTRVIATGGLASLIAPVSKTIEAVEEHLTLEGLRILYERNKE